MTAKTKHRIEEAYAEFLAAIDEPDLTEKQRARIYNAAQEWNEAALRDEHEEARLEGFEEGLAVTYRLTPAKTPPRRFRAGAFGGPMTPSTPSRPLRS